MHSVRLHTIICSCRSSLTIHKRAGPSRLNVGLLIYILTSHLSAMAAWDRPRCILLLRSLLAPWKCIAKLIVFAPGLACKPLSACYAICTT